MSRVPAQLVALLMAATNATVWILASRWARPGRTADLRARLDPPSIVDEGGNLTEWFHLTFPVAVVVAPGWAYEGWINWSSGLDGVLQGVGVGLWALGTTVVLWAARVMGEYIAVEGITVDHRLVTHGPYRFVRHPVYAAMIAGAVGTALVFRSYLVLGVAAVYFGVCLWWASAEEKLLGSPEGFGDAYHAYASGTGRFLPRVRRVR